MAWPWDLDQWEETGGEEYSYRVQGDSIVATDWEGSSQTWGYSLNAGDAGLGDILELSLPETGSPSGDVYTFERQPLDVLLLGPWMDTEGAGEMVYFRVDGHVVQYEVDSDDQIELAYSVDDDAIVLSEVGGPASTSFPYSITGRSTDDLFDDRLAIDETDVGGDVSTYDRYAP